MSGPHRRRVWKLRGLEAARVRQYLHARVDRGLNPWKHAEPDQKQIRLPSDLEEH